MSMYGTIRKPTKAMLMTPTQIAMMEERQRQEREASKIDENAILEHETLRDNYIKESNYYEMSNRSNRKATVRNQRLQNIKTALLSEALMHVCKNSFTLPLSERDSRVVRSTINAFINEQGGAGSVLNSFRTKNLLLSEIYSVCTKYYNKIMESCDDTCCDEDHDFVVDDETKDDFMSELQDLDSDEASQLIKDRVSNSISDFVDTNLSNKMDYEDIIQSIKDRTSASDMTEESATEIARYQQGKLNEKRLRQNKNVFGYMVEQLGNKAYKDEKLKTRYVHEAALNVHDIIHDTELIYTVLEMVNTTCMVNDFSAYLNGYLESFK